MFIEGHPFVPVMRFFLTFRVSEISPRQNWFQQSLFQQVDGLHNIQAKGAKGVNVLFDHFIVLFDIVLLAIVLVL